MSAECYAATSMQTELNSSRKGQSSHISVSVTNKIMENQDSRYNLNENEDVDEIIEYDTVVSSAQIKNDQLKEQIERIKQFYANQTEIFKSTNSPKLRNVRGKIGTHSLGLESTSKKNNLSVKVARKLRQNSQAIGTDTTGAALGTINNILAGITKPITVPELCSERKKFQNVEEMSKTDVEKLCQDQLHGVEKVRINSKSKQSVSVKSKSKFDCRKVKSKITAITSSSNIKKLKKPAIKIPLERRENQLATINKRSRKLPLKSRFPNSYPTKNVNLLNKKHTGRNSDLVEIYHNNAAKESKSSESDVTKNKCLKEDSYNNDKTRENIVPPLTITEDETKAEPKQIVSCIYRNYTLPTISSRMKRVAKCYMNSFNIKTIPFCLTTSTSASHNIGVNIQQVMSMVKSKQLIGRLSPTLAYNIGLAAGKNENSLPFFVSSVTSRTFCNNCPLSKSTINFQYLQEVAKTIPQETIEEAEEIEEVNSPETQSMIITGPSGDVKVTNRKQTVWTASFDDKKCTCITPKGIGFQKIIDKFNGGVSKQKPLTTSIPTTSIPVVTMRPKERKVEVASTDEKVTNKPSQDITPIQNKEKKLKEVLGKLHDDFEKMTITYDELLKKSEENKADPNIAGELEKLDKQLNSKEEEIIMVMSLYKEVLALKKQVNSLKSRTSKDNVSQKIQSSNCNGYNNVTTAGLLNKLLRRVHHFQTHYKRP